MKKVFQSLNNGLIKYGRTYILMLIISSVALFFVGKKIKSSTGISPQFLSPISVTKLDFKVLDKEVFERKFDVIQQPKIAKWYYCWFFLDLFFAFFLLASIYTIVMALLERKKPFVFLLLILIIAYLVDITEDIIYLNLIIYLKGISSVKLIMYSLGILFLLFSLVYRVLKK